MPTPVYSLLHAATFATLTNVNFDDDRFKVGAEHRGSSAAHACMVGRRRAAWGGKHVEMRRRNAASCRAARVLRNKPHPHLPSRATLVMLHRSTLCSATRCARAWRRRAPPRASAPRPLPPACPGSTCCRTPPRECRLALALLVHARFAVRCVCIQKPHGPCEHLRTHLLAAPAPFTARSFRPSQAHLANASIEHLVDTGKKVSLEHRRHHVDPTLLGLHEVRGRGRGWELTGRRACARAPAAACRDRAPCARATALTTLPYAHASHRRPPTVPRPPQMICYGLRGLCAYAHHAEVVGQRDADVDAFVAEGYAFLCSEDALDLGKVGAGGARWLAGRAGTLETRGGGARWVEAGRRAQAAAATRTHPITPHPSVHPLRRPWPWWTPRAPPASRAWPCWTTATPPSLGTRSPRRRARGRPGAPRLQPAAAGGAARGRRRALAGQPSQSLLAPARAPRTMLLSRRPLTLPNRPA